jgi:hypothetical protein
LTLYTAKQTYAEGKLMLSGGAATTTVFTQNNLSFGLYPPAGQYSQNGVYSVADGAQLLDTAMNATRCGNYVAGACKASIRVGWIMDDRLFTQAQCSASPGHAVARGLSLVGASPGTVGTIPSFAAGTSFQDMVQGHIGAGYLKSVTTDGSNLRAPPAGLAPRTRTNIQSGRGRHPAQRTFPVTWRGPALLATDLFRDGQR